MSSSRRFIAGVIRLGLVVVGLGLCVGFLVHKMPSRNRRVRMQKEVPASDSLAPADLRIYNADSAVDLVLMGNKVLAGLSPKTVAKVKADMENSSARDTGGLGGSIAQLVKKSVAGAIGTHAAFPISDIRDIRYDNGQIVFDWTDGGNHEIFHGTNVNGEKTSNTFRAEDAQRFIDAFHARKKGGQ